MPTNTNEDVETIALENVFKIASQEGLVNGKSIFQIMTSSGKFTLGTDSIEETEKWINALHEELFGPPKHDVVCKYKHTRNLLNLHSHVHVGHNSTHSSWL